MIYLAHNLWPTFPKIQLNHLPALYTEKYMQYYPFWSSYHKWLRYCVNEANIWDFLYAMFIHLLTNFCVKMRFICQFMYKWADTGKNVTLEKSEESFCGSVKQALWNNPPPPQKKRTLVTFEKWQFRLLCLLTHVHVWLDASISFSNNRQ